MRCGSVRGASGPVGRSASRASAASTASSKDSLAAATSSCARRTSSSPWAAIVRMPESSSKSDCAPSRSSPAGDMLAGCTLAVHAASAMAGASPDGALSSAAASPRCAFSSTGRASPDRTASCSEGTLSGRTSSSAGCTSMTSEGASGSSTETAFFSLFSSWASCPDSMGIMIRLSRDRVDGLMISMRRNAGTNRHGIVNHLKVKRRQYGGRPLLCDGSMEADPSFAATRREGG